MGPVQLEGVRNLADHRADDRQIEIDATTTMSQEERLKTLDFEQMTTAEVAEAKRMLARLSLALARARAGMLSSKICCSSLRRSLAVAFVAGACGSLLPSGVYWRRCASRMPMPGVHSSAFGRFRTSTLMLCAVTGLPIWGRPGFGALTPLGGAAITAHGNNSSSAAIFAEPEIVVDFMETLL